MRYYRSESWLTYRVDIYLESEFLTSLLNSSYFLTARAAFILTTGDVKIVLVSLGKVEAHPAFTFPALDFGFLSLHQVTSGVHLGLPVRHFKNPSFV